VRIVCVLDAFPTTERDRPQAIADLATAGLIEFAATQGSVTPLEWWISTMPGADAAVAATIDRGPYVSGVVSSRMDRAAQLSADPVALGIIGALSLGFVVAGLFAVIGLAVSAAVSARQRRTEFALLRALGLSSGQLSGWLWLENAGIVVVSLAAGTGLGLLIGWVVLPFVTVTQDAAAPFPPPLVRTPWQSIAVLVAISTLALGATVMVLARVLRRIGIGSVLRMGED
jgi:predicted lysophospholipase L1 biosynthesis ABC-type transport system permease subunit